MFKTKLYKNDNDLNEYIKSKSCYKYMSLIKHLQYTNEKIKNLYILQRSLCATVITLQIRIYINDKINSRLKMCYKLPAL